MPPKKKTTLTPLPEGWILTDMERKDWRLGKIIGRGGFGLIYLAAQQSDAPVPDDSPFVIKVEYYENGPLFSELKFYQRAAKQESLQKWRKSQRLDFLGVPTYWGYGMSEFQGRRYRFMVLDRLGTDLQKVCDGNGGRLKRQTVLRLGCLLLDVLEYIHENEYVHADVKAANLLLDYKDPSKVYLADYGLSYRYCPKGVHKEYKENPKIRHNGTIEYTSMDAHNGVAPSRRGDLEVLGYCLLHWLCGRLPWDSVLKNPLLVQEAKAELMANLPDSVLQLSPSDSSTGEVAMLLQCVKTLAYKERPNYQALRDVLAGGLLRTELKGSPLDLGPGGPPSLKMQTKARPAMKEERLKPVAWETGDVELRGGTSLPSASAQVRQAKTSARPSYPRTERQRVSQARSAARQEPLQPEEARRVRWRESKKEEEEEEDNLKPAAPEPRYSLREGNWPLKLYSGTITVLFLCLLVLYAL